MLFILWLIAVVLVIYGIVRIVNRDVLLGAAHRDRAPHRSWRRQHLQLT